MFAEHLICNAHNVDPPSAQLVVSKSILLDRLEVACAIKLDGEIGSFAEEVDHVSPDNLLSAKMKSAKTIASHLVPKPALLGSHIAPKLPRSGEHRRRNELPFGSPLNV